MPTKLKLAGNDLLWVIRFSMNRIAHSKSFMRDTSWPIDNYLEATLKTFLQHGHASSQVSFRIRGLKIHDGSPKHTMPQRLPPFHGPITSQELVRNDVLWMMFVSTEKSVVHSSSFMRDASGLKQLPVGTQDGPVRISRIILETLTNVSLHELRLWEIGWMK